MQIKTAQGHIIPDVEEKCLELARLLLEARDALPAITETSARLHGVSFTLADRIEEALEPWRVEDNAK